jgi:4-hydroxybenzoate polyprenyltransferase
MVITRIYDSLVGVKPRFASSRPHRLISRWREGRNRRTKRGMSAALPQSPLPDAAPANWVDRRAPPSLRPWLKLGRFDRPVGAWLLLLPGWQGAALASSQFGRWPDLVLFAKIFVGAFVMRAAGCAWNDILDRDIDAKVARTALRPIAAGQIGVRQALGFIAGCSLVGLAILLTMTPLAVGLGAGSLLLVAAYPLMKRITWWPQAWLGLTFNWGALLGYAAVTGRLGWPPALLYASGLFWTLGYDTVYAIQDLEDDALAGVKSSARRLGRQAPRAVLIFYGVSFGLVMAATLVAKLGPLLPPFAALYAVHLGRQAAKVKLDDPALALKLFKSNRAAGLILLAGLIAGLWRAGG